jgi:hypothetical protein
MQNLEDFQSPMIEYIWQPIKSRTTKTGERVKLSEPIKKGKKIAVLFAGVHKDNPDVVGVGFAMCHSQMDCDGILRSGGLKMKDPEAGKKIAAGRALKWQKKSGCFSKKSFMQTGKPDEVAVPSSIAKDLVQFTERVVRYYKDKKLPMWVTFVPSI